MLGDDVPPRVLASRTIDGLAKYIKEKNVRRVVVMVGAGLSTAAGIPDFRSPDTGLYANLARLNLPYPEAVFDISYFRENPLPFYALAKEMFPGQHKPTKAHCFIQLLHKKGLLLKCFTQNIDCLEREAGLPGDKIVEAHGSFATHSCTGCKRPYPDELMRKAIETDEVPQCPKCKEYVKPDIVFFGEALPSSFFDNMDLTSEADLCIVMGTSLTVQPFATLPFMCHDKTPRVLMNLTPAGDLGGRREDVLVLDECDKSVTKLAEALGWEKELNALFSKINPDKAAAATASIHPPSLEPVRSREEQLHDEIERLTTEIDDALHISRSHEKQVRSELDRDNNSDQEEKVGSHVSGTDTPAESKSQVSTDDDVQRRSTASAPHKEEKPDVTDTDTDNSPSGKRPAGGGGKPSTTT